MLKRILTTIGAGRLIAVALTAGIAAGALVAAPLFASARSAYDTPNDIAVSPAYERLLNELALPSFLDDSNETAGVYRSTLDGAGEFGIDWVIEDAGDAGQSFEFKAAVGSGDPVHIGGDLTEIVAELTGTDQAAVAEALEDGQTLVEYANAHGVSEDALLDELLNDAEERLTDAVESGELTEEQADRIRTELREHLSDLITGDGPFGHFGIDHPEASGDFPLIGDHFMLEFDPVAKVAELTGVEAKDVFAALENGQTLAAFAATHGIGEDDLVAAIVADTEERAGEAVADGDLTQEEADEILSRLEEHVRAVVNGEDFGIAGGVLREDLGNIVPFAGFFGPGECHDSDDNQDQESDGGENTSDQI